jgi:hypothetical protein
LVPLEAKPLLLAFFYSSCSWSVLIFPLLVGSAMELDEVIGGLLETLEMEPLCLKTPFHGVEGDQDPQVGGASEPDL